MSKFFAYCCLNLTALKLALPVCFRLAVLPLHEPLQCILQIAPPRHIEILEERFHHGPGTLRMPTMRLDQASRKLSGERIRLQTHCRIRQALCFLPVSFDSCQHSKAAMRFAEGRVDFLRRLKCL